MGRYDCLLNLLFEGLHANVLTEQLKVLHLVRPFNLFEDGLRRLLVEVLNGGADIQPGERRSPRLGPKANRLEAAVVIQDVQNIHLVDFNQAPEHIIGINAHIFVALSFKFGNPVLNDSF